MPDIAASDATLFKTARAFETWLRKHHASSEGIWLRVAKKGADETSVSCPEALEVALCWGWIDGHRKGLDDQHFLQRYSPRRAKSLWSKINVGKAKALIESGRMQPPGQAQVDAAKADGRWDAAYDAAPAARAFFATVSATNRYAVLWRVQTAKRPQTRAKRIALLVDMLARGETFHPQK